MSEWTRVDQRHLCPICGAQKYCSTHHTGWVKCMKRGDGDAPEKPGWTFKVALKGTKGEILDGGNKWIPDGFVERDVSIQEQRSLDDKQAAVRQRRAGQARKLWGQAGSEAIDGGSNHPRAIAYFEARGIKLGQLPGAKLPASIRYHPHCEDRWMPAPTNRWATFPAIISVIASMDQKIEGIHRIFLDADKPEKRGPEYGEAKRQLGTVNGRSVVLNDSRQSGVLVLCEGIETGLAILASLNIIRLKAAVWAMSHRVSLAYAEFAPGVLDFGVDNAFHTVIIAGDLDKSRDGQTTAGKAASRIVKNRPWLTVEVRLPTSQLCGDLVCCDGGIDSPAEGKSVDWLDVYNAHSATVVARGLTAGLDLLANGRRASEWAQRDLETFDEDQQSSSSPMYLDDGPVSRARRFLLDKESPDGQARNGSSFLLKRFDGLWYEYDGTQWREFDEELLVGRVWHWMDGFYTHKRGSPAKIDPTYRTVQDVVKAMMIDTAVAGDAMPTWTAASFSSSGKPLWGTAAPRERDKPKNAPRSGGIIAYTNGLLDVEHLAATRQIKMFKHSPRWFSGSCLPYVLSLDKLRDAMANDDAAREVLEEMCPDWLKFLATAWDDPSAAECLQEWFGYILTSDTSLERILLIQGPGGSGKGTIESALSAMIGDDNIVPTSFDKLTQRFHLGTFVGKLAAIMSDAHIGKKTDGTQAMELLKSISGNDPVQIEEKYNRKMPLKRLKTRFVVFCNEMPLLLDSSNALAQRLCLIPMGKSFRDRADPSLKERIRSQVPGITIWAILGLLRLLERVEQKKEAIDSGDTKTARLDVFTKVEIADNMMEEFRRDSSPHYGFVMDCCVTTNENGERPSGDVSTIYEAWKMYAEDNERKPGSRESLGRKLRSVVSGLDTKQRTEGARQRYFVGVGLNAEWKEKVAKKLGSSRSGGDGGDGPADEPGESAGGVLY